MKLKSLIMAFLFTCSMTAFADKYHHAYPKSDKAEVNTVTPEKSAQLDKLKYYGYCEIEIINDSYYQVQVYGTTDSGASLWPFYINRVGYDYPHYIDLVDDYGFCHRGMYLYIYSRGYLRYSGYTEAGTTLHIWSYQGDELKVTTQKK